MKGLTLTVATLFSYQSMALTVINDEPVDGENVVAAQKYLRFNPVSTPEIRAVPPKAQMPGLPATSHLKEGLFDSYKLSDCQKYPTPFFVVGPDQTSIAWLKAHSNHLKAVHALGLVTNIENEKDLKEVDAISPVNLIPSNIDGLAEVVQAQAYPFYTNGCEVRQ